MIPSAPATSASVNNSKIRQRTMRRAETPSALSVRRTGRRCSNARPTEPCTIARPTANDRSPNAVRFRWKLSVRRPRSLAVDGGLIASSGARDARSGRSSGWTGATNILLKPSTPSSSCAVVMSARTMFGARPSIARSLSSRSGSRAAVAGLARSTPFLPTSSG